MGRRGRRGPDRLESFAGLGDLLHTGRAPMNATHQFERYSSLAAGTHWLVAAQRVSVYACINFSSLYPENSAAQIALTMWHFTLGLSVLGIAFLQVVNRLTRGALAYALRQTHESFGIAGYHLIGLHAAAALFHHYVLKDGTLVRMWPERNADAEDLT